MRRERARPSRRVRGRWIALAALLLVVATVWVLRTPLLTSFGRLLVEEDPWAPADIVALVSANPIAVASVGAEAVRSGYTTRVLLLEAEPRPEDVLVRSLGISVPSRTELAALVLVKLRVPREALVVEHLRRNGTNVAIQAVAAYAKAHGMTRVIIVTSRSHTRRAGILLRRALPPGAHVVVRASPEDEFRVDGWWRDRDHAREVLVESLRWMNSFALGDLW